MLPAGSAVMLYVIPGDLHYEPINCRCMLVPTPFTRFGLVHDAVYANIMRYLDRLEWLDMPDPWRDLGGEA